MASGSASARAERSNPRTALGGRRRPTRRKERARGPLKPEDRVGELLGGTYRIERLIAVGGMGSVYEVSHTRLQQHFAVKFLDSAFVNNEEAYSRFRQEAEIAARLNHGAVVQVFDFNMDGEGNPYMVMELVSGETLDDCAAKRKASRLNRDEILGIFGHLCEALDACHDHDIVHRDLKPSNIVVRGVVDEIVGDATLLDPTKLWEVKLLDFGISKIKSQGDDDGMTRDNVVMGTPNYMSPEQAQGFNKNLDRRTDIFSLGAILYEVLSGNRAFDGDNLPQILHSIVYDQPPALSGVPAAVVAVVSRAMAKDPADRYGRAADMLADLRAAYRVKKVRKHEPSNSSLAVSIAWGLSLLVSAGAAYGVAHTKAISEASNSASGGRVSDAVAGETVASAKPGGMFTDKSAQKSARHVANLGDGYDATFVGSPAARMLVDEGQLYRADASGLSFWTDAEAPPKRVVLPSTAAVTALSMSSEGRELLVGQADGTLTRWERSFREKIAERNYGNEPITNVAGGSGYLAIGTAGKVKLYSESTGKVIKSVSVSDDPVALEMTRNEPITVIIVGQSSATIIDADARRVLFDGPLDSDIVAAGLRDELMGQDPVFWVESRRGAWAVTSDYRITPVPARKAARVDIIKQRRIR